MAYSLIDYTDTSPQNDELDNKLNHLFEDIGTGTYDWYEIHTLYTEEPEIECIHLTTKAKASVKSLIQQELQTKLSEAIATIIGEDETVNDTNIATEYGTVRQAKNRLRAEQRQAAKAVLLAMGGKEKI
jgi:hypothetical protein